MSVNTIIEQRDWHTKLELVCPTI